MSKVVISGHAYGRLRRGHLWVFSNEIKGITEDIRDGALVDVLFKGRKIATGYYNSQSQITVRLLTFREEMIDLNFFKRRIRDAYELRLRMGYSPEDSFRLIYSEGDGLPGLIVDKLNRVFVISILTLGMERLKRLIVDALVELFEPEAIVEKSDSALRNLEGLEPFRGIIYGKLPEEVIITQDQLKFKVDPVGGQKTGFYFDQRWNRRVVRAVAEKLLVLDVFAYTGAFGLYALKGGAVKVDVVEESSRALQLLEENYKLNGFYDRLTVYQGNAFQILRELRRAGKRYDLIVVDPPAFAKTRGGVEPALKGYKDINIQAMRLVKDGGYLATSSCSQKVSTNMFLETVLSAADDCNVHLQLLYSGGQAPDHPIPLAMPETRYLKFFLFKVRARR